MNLSKRINETLAVPLWVIEETEKLEAERDALAAHVERLEQDLEEPAQMQADAYRQAVRKIHPYVAAARLPASLDASLYLLLKMLDGQDRLIAEKQAEAFQGLLAQYKTRSGYLDIHADEVRRRLAELRRQAEQAQAGKGE